MWRASVALVAVAVGCGGGPPCGGSGALRLLWAGTANGRTDASMWAVDLDDTGQLRCPVELEPLVLGKFETFTWSPDGAHVALSEQSSLTVFDVSTSPPSARSAPIDGNLGLSFSTTGRWGMIQTATTTGGPTFSGTPIGGDLDVRPWGSCGSNGSLRLSPSSDRFLLRGAGDLCVFDPDAPGGEHTTDLKLVSAAPFTITAWSPDGRWIGDTHDAAGVAVVGILDGDDLSAPPRDLGDPAGGVTFGAWSPDSSRFTVEAPAGIEVVDFSTGIPIVQRSISTDEVLFGWVDAGHFLTATELAGGPNTVSIVDADTGASVQLANNVVSWSRIAGRMDLSVLTVDRIWEAVPLDGSAPRPIGQCTFLTWSPDGAIATCASARSLDVIDAATGAVVDTIDTAPYTSSPVGVSWSPDSRWAWLTDERTAHLLDAATRSVSSVDETFSGGIPQWQPNAP